MKRIALIMIAALLAFSANWLGGCAVNQTAPRTIVHKDAQFPAEELRDHLEKVTGAKFKIIGEQDFDGKGAAFYVGRTEFARKNGVDFSNFAAEEWMYRTIGNNVVIGGGCWYGSEIAVYEFLENELGCHWFTFESEYIPSKPDLKIGKLDKRGAPAFLGRAILLPHWGQESVVLRDKMKLTILRNRGNIYRSPQIRSGQYISDHSFYEYVSPEKFFKDHPEYFSMGADGKRYHGNSKIRGGGQLCLSNPEVAEIATEQLREFVRADRAKYPKEKWPTLYDISQLDGSDSMCYCPACKKITAAEGSESALVLTFINRIASAIAREYPEISIQTMAYVSTETAPAIMRPKKNVVIQWCDLYSKSDCFRPLAHPFNAKQKEIFEGWKKIGARMAIWDYWNLVGSNRKFFNPPRIETMIDAIAPDIRYYHASGVEGYFVEAEAYLFSDTPNFHYLQHWLGYQLLNNPGLDEEKLVATYMKHHYGPAEKPMSEFLDDLRQAVKAEPKPLYYLPSLKQTYLTRDFVKKVYAELKEAHAATSPGSPYRLRVEKEMIAPLAVMLHYGDLRLGKSKNEIFQEYKTCRENQLNAYYPAEDLAKVEKLLDKELAVLMFDFPTPERFRHLPPEKIRKFAYPAFRGSIIDDPESPVGKTVKMRSDNPQKDDELYAMKPLHGLYPTTFGVQNVDTKKEITFTIVKFPADEKYHWYKVGSIEFGTQTIFFGWWWWILADISSVYCNADGVPGFNTWEAWISVKITGPVYVKDSQAKNGIYLDQLILIKP